MSEPYMHRAPGVHHVEQVMGMAVSIDIRDTGAPPTAVPAVVEWLHHVDATFSTYKLDSPISALGRGELSFAGVSEEVRDILRRCEDLRIETDGAFDAFAVPAPNGTSLDPSGLVKGWSIEQSATILETYGCRNFCINAGGDIALRGSPAPGEEWLIGIRHPDDRQAMAIVVAGADRLAIATSASYERGAHIIDPFTGAPIAELASVTVTGPDLTLADAYATAVYVMGEVGLEWLADQSGYDGCVITHEGGVRTSPGWPHAAA